MKKRTKMFLTGIALAILAVFGFRVIATPTVSMQQQHIPAHRVQYTAKMVCGDVTDNLGDWPVVAGFYKTLVNVRNNTEADVMIDKHISLAYHDGQAFGREPNLVQDQWQDQIQLNPHSSTMDDCERIYQLTGIIPGTFLDGYIEFNAFTTGARDIPGLVVDAYYTAGNFEHPELVPSITIQRIENDYVM